MELMGEEEPSNGGFCSSSSPQGPVAKAALLAHSGASTYSAFPALFRHSLHAPRESIHAAAPAPAAPCAARTAAGGGLCSLLEMPLSHRAGLQHWGTPHAQARPGTGTASCWKSNSSPCCPPAPILTLQRMRE